MPYVGGRGFDHDYELRCLKDKEHLTITPRDSHRGIRKLYNGATHTWEEFDIMSQQPIGHALANLPTDETQMSERFKKALNIGIFPDQMSGDQLAVVAKVAVLYRLDPLMGEIMPYQGRPYITIAGRRRKDDEAGRKPGIKFRFLTADERTGFMDVGALAEGDLAQVCILIRDDNRLEVEGFGRALASEAHGNERLPIVSRRIEMAQKRAERRAREMAYGPVPRPTVLDVAVMEEGDEVVEGEVVHEELAPSTEGVEQIAPPPMHDVLDAAWDEIAKPLQEDEPPYRPDFADVGNHEA